MFQLRSVIHSLRIVSFRTHATRSHIHASSCLFNQKRDYRLVPLHGHETAVAKEKEITLYIKVSSVKR